MACYLGLDAVLLVAAAAGDTPEVVTGLAEYDEVVNVDLNISAGEADVTTRANDGWRSFCQTLKEATIDVTAMYKGSNTELNIIRAAFLGNDLVDAAVMTGGEAPREGLVGRWAVTEFSLGQQLEEGQEITISLRLNDFGAWLVQAS